jgi:hypothetical protein
MLQQSNLELQLGVSFGKLPCSFRNALIEFTRTPLLLIQAHLGPPLQVICASCAPFTGVPLSRDSQNILIDLRSGIRSGDKLNELSVERV